jgi:N-acetylglutamate synthase-like GNAT family acetyltransferase
MPRAAEQRWFLVALAGKEVVGFLIARCATGRFGSPPCGWLFAIDIEPRARQAGIGTRLLTALCEAPACGRRAQAAHHAVERQTR